MVRTLTLVSAAGRVLIGAGMLAAPRLALPALGFSAPSDATIALARLAGVRDLVLAGQLLASLENPPALRRAHLAAATSDAGDTAVFAGLMRSEDPSLAEGGQRGFTASLPAALGSLWLALQAKD